MPIQNDKDCYLCVSRGFNSSNCPLHYTYDVCAEEHDHGYLTPIYGLSHNNFDENTEPSSSIYNKEFPPETSLSAFASTSFFDSDTLRAKFSDLDSHFFVGPLSENAAQKRFKSTASYSPYPVLIYKCSDGYYFIYPESA